MTQNPNQAGGGNMVVQHAVLNLDQMQSFAQSVEQRYKIKN